MFQVCATVDHIGNSQEKGLYRDTPESVTHSQLRVPTVGCCYREHRTTEGGRCPQKHGASGCLTQPGPIGELVDHPVMRVPAIAITSAQTLKTTMLCDCVQLSRSMIGNVILLLPLKPTAQPTRNARQLTEITALIDLSRLSHRYHSYPTPRQQTHALAYYANATLTG